eukprot:491322-Amorphochlora_amoeboformis.AAC.3
MERHEVVILTVNGFGALTEKRIEYRVRSGMTIDTERFNDQTPGEAGRGLKTDERSSVQDWRGRDDGQRGKLYGQSVQNGKIQGCRDAREG